MKSPWRTVFLIWAGWYLALMIFQQINWQRFTIQRPDNGYAWVAGMTGGEYDSPDQGAWFYARWDSYRYVKIAQEGYSDPKWSTFFPGYPIMMRIVDTALALYIKETPSNHRMALAGVIVSAIMSYVAAVGMYVFTRDRLGAEFAERGMFYLLIFPTAMFMIQVYTESAYLAVSLWALIFAYRKQWWIAGALAIYATLTRPTGLFLFFPMFTIWLDHWWRGKTLHPAVLLAVFAPVITFFTFNSYLSANGIDTIEAQQDFGRHLLHPAAVLALIQQIGWMGAHPNGTIQIGFDLLLTLFTTMMCLLEFWRHSGLALYGLAATWISLATGQLVSQNRYVLIVIPIYFVLVRWGQNKAIDRTWTVISLLLLALYQIQFTQGLWTG